MEFVVRYLLLIVLALPASALETLKPGDKVDDFTMLSVNGFGQRLTEVRGQPLMLIWLDRCNACSETLARYQLLAESLEIDGLLGWFVWVPEGDDEPPKMRLPVLRYEAKWQQSWLFEPRPAVMLISPDGVLDHLIIGDLDESYGEVEATMMRWISDVRDQ